LFCSFLVRQPPPSGPGPHHSWGFLDHTRRRTTDCRTPLDEWSVRRRDPYLITHNIHKKQTSMPPVGFEPTISAGERPFELSFFFSKIVLFMGQGGKILSSGAGHRWQYGSSALHAGYLRLQIHTLRYYNTHCFSRTMVVRTRLNATLYIHILPVLFMPVYVYVYFPWTNLDK